MAWLPMTLSEFQVYFCCLKCLKPFSYFTSQVLLSCCATYNFMHPYGNMNTCTVSLGGEGCYSTPAHGVRSLQIRWQLAEPDGPSTRSVCTESPCCCGWYWQEPNIWVSLCQRAWRLLAADIWSCADLSTARPRHSWTRKYVRLVPLFCCQFNIRILSTLLVSSSLCKS